MAVSYLKREVRKAAERKKLDWPNSIDRVVWEADKRLDEGRINLAEAMEMVRGAFGSELDKFDYESIEKEIRHNL